MTRNPRVVVLEYEVHGTAPSTGKPYDNRFCSIVTIEDRKIVRWRDYMDSLAPVYSWCSFECFCALDCRDGSAVDDNFSAVDVGSAVGYQESNKLGNFLGATGAADRNAAE